MNATSDDQDKVNTAATCIASCCPISTGLQPKAWLIDYLITMLCVISVSSLQAAQLHDC